MRFGLFELRAVSIQYPACRKAKSSEMKPACMPTKQRVSGWIPSHVVECALEAQAVEPNRSNLLEGAIAHTACNLEVRDGPGEIPELYDKYVCFLGGGMSVCF